jgi:hypothetical protein
MALVARRVTRWHEWTVPAGAALTPAVAAWMSSTSIHVHGFLDYANASGALAFLAGAAALLVALRARHLWVRTGAAALAVLWIAAPWFLGARTASVLALALPAVALTVRTRRALRRLLAGGALLAVAGLVGTVLLAETYAPGEVLSPSERIVDATLGEIRIELWREALTWAGQGPLTGLGPGGFRQVSTMAETRSAAAWAHNEFLQAAAETGVIGAGLLAALFAWAGWRVWRSHCPTCAGVAGAAVIGTVLNASIDYVLHFAIIPLALAAIVGAGSGARCVPDAHAPKRRDQPDRQAVRRVYLYAVGLWILLAIPSGLLNPPYAVPNGAAWTAHGAGVSFESPGLVTTIVPPHELYRAVVSRSAVSIALWVTPLRTVQPSRSEHQGPTRVVSSSSGTMRRNLTIGQEREALVVRLRTTATDEAGAELSVPGVFRAGEKRHIVVAADGSTTRVYVNGRLWALERGPGGDLSNWDHSYPLVLGNETDGQRPWLGSVDGVTVYDRVLAPEEVAAQSEYVSSVPTPAEDLGSPLVLYARSSAGDEVVSRPELTTAPNVIVTLPQSFLTAFTALHGGAGWPNGGGMALVARAIAYGLLFAPFGFLTQGLPHRRDPGWATGPLLVCATVVISSAFLQYLQGRAPSLVGVVAAVTGTAIGTAAARARLPHPQEPQRRCE